MRRCKWHKCNREFEPGRRAQLYCCGACQLERASWTRARGGTLVDKLLNNDVAGLVAAKKKIEKEIRDATSRFN